MEQNQDETQKIIEYVRTDSSEGDIEGIEQIVTFIDPEGNRSVYYGNGDGSRIEVIMPDTTKIDVDYAKNSVEGLGYEDIILGVSSENGILEIPEDAVKLVSEYGYSVSVTNGDMHVILDSGVVKKAESLEGDVILTVQQTTDDILTQDQQRTIGSRYAISVTLTVNGDTVSELEGNAEVNVSPGYAGVDVYRVEPDGSLVEIGCEYDSETGNVRFTVDHLSVYMVEPEAYHGKVFFTLSLFTVAMVLILAPVLFIRKEEW